MGLGSWFSSAGSWFGTALRLGGHGELSPHVVFPVPGDFYTSSVNKVQRAWLLDCNGDGDDWEFGT